MSIKKHAVHPDPEFFPENVEFLGFMGGWDCDVGSAGFPKYCHEEY